VEIPPSLSSENGPICFTPSFVGKGLQYCNRVVNRVFANSESTKDGSSALSTSARINFQLALKLVSRSVFCWVHEKIAGIMATSRIKNLIFIGLWFS
jgi:hypothetical protein